MKLSTRYSEKSLVSGSEDQTGRIFFNDSGFVDLSDVEIVGVFVDTIRQLFYGLPDEGLLHKLDTHVANKEQLIYLGESGPGALQWHLCKMGKECGYRYKLQNNVEGIVILFGSYYKQLDKPGQHLKIELSPHFISQRSVKKIWQRLYGEFGGLSRAFLHDPEPKGVAVHLAVDYQNWVFPSDFLSRLSAYTRTIKTFDGISDLDLSGFSEAIASYGGHTVEKNYLIGRADQFQVCMYDKTVDMIRTDKQDYMQKEWEVYSLGSYDPAKVVRRLELRFHHTIIREIGEGMDKSLESWLDVADHLTDIWRYGMGVTRYNIDERKGTNSTMHPIWQLFMQDAEFYVPADGLTISRKKKQAVDPVAKNIDLLLGNLISLSARSGFKASAVIWQVRQLKIWPQIESYLRSRGIDDSQFRQNIEKALSMRKLIGKAA